MTVTVLAGPERRRRWTTAEKLRIVGESVAPDAMVSEVARRHDIHPHQLHAWRRLARLGLLAPAAGAAMAGDSAARFVPVAVVAGGAGSSGRNGPADVPLPIELVLRNGRVLRLPEGIAPERAAALADALEGLGR